MPAGTSNASNDNPGPGQAARYDARTSPDLRAAATDQELRDQLVRETRIATLDQLSAFVAHDLRNPLGVIRLAASLLRRRLAKIDFDLECLNEIEAEVQTADSILTNLLDATRSRDPDPREVDLGPLLADAARDVDPSGRLRWSIALRPDVGTAWCDPDQIRQVFKHVLRNAVEAMKGQGTIAIDGRRDGTKQVIHVRDSGPGVAAEIRADLFEPLVTTKRVGAGLGLTICRRILEHQGGSIDLVLDEKPGAAFQITLPIAAAR